MYNRETIGVAVGYGKEKSAVEKRTEVVYG